MKEVREQFALVSGLMGLSLLAAACFALHYTLSFRARSIPAEGVVVDLKHSSGGKGGSSYRPVVEWTAADGKKRRFPGSVGRSPPAYAQGDRVALRFSPSDPEDARIDDFTENWMLSLMFGLTGALFTGIGAGMCLPAWRRVRVRKWLLAHGTRIQATFTGVYGRWPWILIAQWRNPADQVVYTFKSDPIEFDPTEFVKVETLEVIVNADCPSMYHVDLGFLPGSGG